MESALLAAFAVPPMLLGNAPAPRTRIERGSHLIAHSEAFGLDPSELRDAEVDCELARRLREALRG